MIKLLDVNEIQIAESIVNIQIPAYMVEAELIEFYEIPPLKDTAKTLQKSGECFCGYFIGDELCGVISYKIEGFTLDIYRLIVEPRHFRKGIASKLLSFVEEKVSGVQTITVSTASRNTPAVSFYLNSGFTVERTVEVNKQISLTSFKKEVAR